MNAYRELLAHLAAFLDAGGPLVWVIGCTTLLLWSLIMERALFFLLQWPLERERLLTRWRFHGNRSAKARHLIRRELLSDERNRLTRSMPLIRSLVLVCPLLGLLGTVTGMIQVFDAMTGSAGGNARVISEGVSRATIPTMAGMVAALSGLFAISFLQQRIDKGRAWCEQQLSVHGDAA